MLTCISVYASVWIISMVHYFRFYDLCRILIRNLYATLYLY